MVSYGCWVYYLFFGKSKESGERKAKREARIAELKANQKRHSDLLKQAWELTKQVLSA
jgi:hypothetical protein